MQLMAHGWIGNPLKYGKCNSHSLWCFPIRVSGRIETLIYMVKHGKSQKFYSEREFMIKSGTFIDVPLVLQDAIKRFILCPL